MFGKAYTRHLIARSTENTTERRHFMQAAGAAGLGVVGASVLGATAANADPVQVEKPNIDGAILNFALNLEYLEAEFYHRAAFGSGLPDNITNGVFGRGRVMGGRKVPFVNKAVRAIAQEIAVDEVNHVNFLRAGLGASAVGRPTIDLTSSFNAAATAAGLIKAGQKFDPFLNENNFMLAAFIFEDVGVTAYKGAAPLVTSAAYLEAAAGILAVEAYHAGIIRTVLLDRGLTAAAVAISGARDSLDGATDDDQGPSLGNLVPVDKYGIAFSRTPGQVLNVVYLTPKAATKGGFFPTGVHGVLNTSTAE